MKRTKIFTIALGSIILSSVFAFTPNFTKNSKEELAQETIYTESLKEGKTLLESKCNICHTVKENQDAMLAPPFAHIKKKYSKVYKTKSDFVTAITAFTVNPQTDNAIMFGALKQFKVMPKMGYTKEDVQKIANYIYDGEFAEPKWCGTK
jgi:cytochrome c2